MNYKDLVEMMAEAFTKEDVESVYDELDKALNAGNIMIYEYDTLLKVTNKIERVAW